MQGGYFQKIMVFGFLLFGVIFLLILNLSSPSTGVVPLVGFFVSLFVIILCLISFLTFTFKRKATNNELNYSLISGSFRQGMLLAIFTDSIFALAALKLLTWWDGILLAISFILLELYFKSEKKVANV